MPKFEEFYAELGRRIRERREKSGITQEVLASKVALTRTSVTNIEKGRQKILVHMLVDIAKALEVSPELLLPSRLQTNVLQEVQSNEPKQLAQPGELEQLLKDRTPQEREWILTAMYAAQEVTDGDS